MTRRLSRSTRALVTSFDASADGYVRGEGCGIVVLKRLSDAQAAGDTVHAIIRGSAVKDLTWFRLDGKEMTEEDWGNPATRCFGLRLAGDAIEEVDERGHRIVGDTLLILLNAYWEALRFVLPAHRPKLRWHLLLDTRETVQRRRVRLVRGGRPYEVAARWASGQPQPGHPGYACGRPAGWRVVISMCAP